MIKSLYNLLGSWFTILIITFIVLYIVLVVLFLSIGSKFGLNAVTILFYLIFFASTYYLVRGMYELILIKLRRGKENRLVNVKRMILRGTVGIVVLILLYVLINSAITPLFGIDI